MPAVGRPIRTQRLPRRPGDAAGGRTRASRSSLPAGRLVPARRGRPRVVHVAEEVREREPVERRVVERQPLGLALDELDSVAEAGGVDAPPSLHEHLAALIDPDDAAPRTARQLDRDRRGPGRHVQHRVVRPDLHPRDEEAAPARVLVRRRGRLAYRSYVGPSGAKRSRACSFTRSIFPQRDSCGGSRANCCGGGGARVRRRGAHWCPRRRASSGRPRVPCAPTARGQGVVACARRRRRTGDRPGAGARGCLARRCRARRGERGRGRAGRAPLAARRPAADREPRRDRRSGGGGAPPPADARRAAAPGHGEVPRRCRSGDEALGGRAGFAGLVALRGGDEGVRGRMQSFTSDVESNYKESLR